MLLEYEKEGLLFKDEVSKRNITINRLLEIGKEEILKVIKVDKKKGFIDLSKKQVNEEEKEQCKLRYAKSKQVEVIAKMLSIHTDTPIGTVYKKVIWPLYENHDHALDALKEILQGETTILDGLKIENNIKDELLKIIKERLAIQPFKIRADFKLICNQFEGIEAIKKALLCGEKKSTEEIKIKFNMIGSPLYECSLITKNKKEGIEMMNQALNEVKKSIEKSKGEYILHNPPKVLGENEKNFSEQLKEANENGNGQEEEEENEEGKNEEGIKFNIAKFEDNEFNIKK